MCGWRRVVIAGTIGGVMSKLGIMAFLNEMFIANTAIHHSV